MCMSVLGEMSAKKPEHSVLSAGCVGCEYGTWINCIVGSGLTLGKVFLVKLDIEASCFVPCLWKFIRSCDGFWMGLIQSFKVYLPLGTSTDMLAKGRVYELQLCHCCRFHSWLGWNIKLVLSRSWQCKGVNTNLSINASESRQWDPQQLWTY